MRAAIASSQGHLERVELHPPHPHPKPPRARTTGRETQHHEAAVVCVLEGYKPLCNSVGKLGPRGGRQSTQSPLSEMD